MAPVTADPPAGLAALAAALRSGELEPATYVDSLESRFAAREPEILAFVPEEGRFERLRRQARDLLARWTEPAGRPPLFGVPVAVKDIFHAAGFATGAGSRLPPAELAGPEAASVAALRAAGALVLGKAVTTEFAAFGPGPTRNPVDPAHTPGGSSSGSAAAVAAGLCPLALGTQTIASVSRPAAFCGAVGCKPTYGRVSRAGVIPLAPSFDHVGFFTPDAAGAALAAAVLVREWRPPQPGQPPRRPVLAVPEGPYLERATAEGLDRFRAVCRRLADAGYEVRSVPSFADFAAVEARHWTLFDGEAARSHARWFPRFRDLYHPKTVEMLERGQAIPEAELDQARGALPRFRRQLLSLMDEQGIDLWLAPGATGPAPEGLTSTGDPVMSIPWTQAGFPTLTLPAGRAANGLPLGLQLAARFDRDEALLAWGEGIEAAVSLLA
jgi:Asp-tRNA(Asn)/Glu-tRNA(Gln) amidotransferase A subunit family amidase